MFLIGSIGNKQFSISRGESKVLFVDNAKSEISLHYGYDNENSMTGDDLKQAKNSITLEVLKNDYKYKKVISFKKRRRKGYSRKKGHRQVYDVVRLTV